MVSKTEFEGIFDKLVCEVTVALQSFNLPSDAFDHIIHVSFYNNISGDKL
jgi:hypothetical protein